MDSTLQSSRPGRTMVGQHVDGWVSSCNDMAQVSVVYTRSLGSPAQTYANQLGQTPRNTPCLLSAFIAHAQPRHQMTRTARLNGSIALMNADEAVECLALTNSRSESPNCGGGPEGLVVTAL